MQNRSMPPGKIIPVLVYEDLVAAVSFLCQSFGFQERLRIGTHRCQLVYQGESVVVTSGGQQGEHYPTHSIMVVVDDVDGFYESVIAAGVNVDGKPETYPFGERQFSVVDSGGHVWTFSQSVADVDPADWGGKWMLG